LSKNVTNSSFLGDNGNDTINATLDVIGSIFNGNSDDDQITVSGTLRNSSIFGGKQSDTLTVDGVTDSLVSGDKANDVINIEEGALSGASIMGGDGVDTITIKAGVTSATSTTVFGGEGNDSIDQLSTRALVIDGQAGNDNIQADTTAKHTIFGGDGNDTIDGSGGGSDQVLDGGAGNDDIEAGSGKDSIDGGAGKDTIAGGGGSDTIFGGAGKDQITTGAGKVFAQGGADEDIIDFTSSAEVTIFGGQGNDTLKFGATTELGTFDIIDGSLGTDVLEFVTADGALVDSQFTNVSNVETLKISGDLAANTYKNVVGAKAQAAGITTVTLDAATALKTSVDASGYTTGITLIGSKADLDDTLIGGSAADVIKTGVDGSVAMTGGGGNDTFEMTSDENSTITDLGGSDVVTVAVGSGTLTATVKSDFTATSSTVNNTTVGNVTFSATANAKVNLSAASSTVGYTVTAQAAIAGKGSSLTGSAGADVVTGNTGIDSLQGGSGNDTINGGAAADTINAGGGDDVIKVTATGDQVATDSIDGGTGTDSIDIDTTAAGVTAVFDFDNIAQVNTFTRTANNTVGITFSQITETTAQTITYTHGARAGALTVTNSSAQANTTFNITGGTGADVLTAAGGLGDDVIDGGAGADTIVGGTGADSITLGALANGIDEINFAATGADSGITVATGDVITGFDLTTGANNSTNEAGLDTFDIGATAAIAGTSNATNIAGVSAGLITFTDSTKALETLATEALAVLDAAGEAAVFENGGNAYVIYQGSASKGIVTLNDTDVQTGILLVASINATISANQFVVA
jgi:Ca2+-binding RTX toxin-like protein